MRDNQPVTQKECRFSDNERLLSSTDTRGVITHCNDDFVRVSGYSREELIGKNHSIVRHPDMPPEVFKELWATLKSGKIWMGLVKNRCKNGDYYWVSAFVTPVFDGSNIVGYESVRITAAEDEKKRADEIYSRLRSGKSPASMAQKLTHYMKKTVPFGAIGGLTAIGLTIIGMPQRPTKHKLPQMLRCKPV